MKTLDDLFFEFRRLNQIKEKIDYYNWFIEDKQQGYMLQNEWVCFSNRALIEILYELSIK